MSFKLLQREKASILFYRTRMKLSISHIARILERSTRTVWRVLKELSPAGKKCHLWYDKRKWPHIIKRRGESWFRAQIRLLQACCWAFLIGLRDDIEVLLGEEPP